MFKSLYAVCIALLSVALLASGAQAQSEYKLKRGDMLQIEVLEDTSLNRSTLVLPDGSISFPLAGSVQAAGRTVGQVSAALASTLTPNFASPPNVFVSVASLAERPVSIPIEPETTDIYITGEITNPGKIEADPGVTILQAIAQAGGLTRFAAGKRIQLRRADKIYLYDYYSNGSDRSVPGSTTLAPGDVIVIPQRRLFE